MFNNNGKKIPITKNLFEVVRIYEIRRYRSSQLDDFLECQFFFPGGLLNIFQKAIAVRCEQIPFFHETLQFLTEQIFFQEEELSVRRMAYLHIRFSSRQWQI